MSGDLEAAIRQWRELSGDNREVTMTRRCRDELEPVWEGLVERLGLTLVGERSHSTDPADELHECLVYHVARPPGPRPKGAR